MTWQNYYLSIDHSEDKSNAPVERIYAKGKAMARKKAADIARLDIK